MKRIEIASLNNLTEFAELFNDYRVFYEQESDIERGRDFLKARITNGETVTFLIKNGDQFAGFVQLYSLFHYKTLKRQWLLSDLFVKPEHRGNGFSIDLINRCKQHCLETNACGLLLETQKTNTVGNKLYPKCDFELDIEHNYYNWWSKQ